MQLQDIASPRAAASGVVTDGRRAVMQSTASPVRSGPVPSSAMQGSPARHGLAWRHATVLDLTNVDVFPKPGPRIQRWNKILKK